MNKATVICVDDERVVLTGLKSQLERYFENTLTIEVTESGEEALELINELIEDKEEIALIISDQIMPGMKGDELLKESHALLPKTLNILLTGQADATAVGNAVNHAKLYRYISKPWDETDLILTVKEAVRSYGQDKKLEIQNEELKELNQNLEIKVKERTAEVVSQKEIIERKNKNITDSINYARRIQTAVLPTQKYISKAFPEHFILYNPKDIVSGDFYWFAEHDNKTLIIAADCTGHGVPGAFVSMMAISFLNEIVKDPECWRQESNASSMLEVLRTKVKTALKQSGKTNETKDGMDLALCIINNETKQLQFAGAHNPLFIIRQSDQLQNLDHIQKKKITEFENYSLIHIQSDSQPIGIHVLEKPFTNINIQLLNNDKIYLFSDGYVDQVGGHYNKKFMTKNFKQLLLTAHKETMEDQKQILEETFIEWKNGNEQIDDVVVVGFEINN